MLRDLGLPVALRDRQFFRPLGLRGPFTWLDMRATLCLGAFDPAEVAPCSHARRVLSNRRKEMVPWKIADGIADVRLNRADKMNAFDPAMFRAIAEAGALLREDRSLRAVVLSGEGRAFCAVSTSRESAP